MAKLADARFRDIVAFRIASVDSLTQKISYEDFVGRVVNRRRQPARKAILFTIETSSRVFLLSEDLEIGLTKARSAG